MNKDTLIIYKWKPISINYIYIYLWNPDSWRLIESFSPEAKADTAIRLKSPIVTSIMIDNILFVNVIYFHFIY